ncbi:AI-2E family transporter [Streptomyces sp. NPDC051172]|uniref:AI-2E family transporter n=1 Tax=Streptomyces sp. NPDC051172 TaxID=3155796 RepID=UPI00342DECC6
MRGRTTGISPGWAVRAGHGTGGRDPLDGCSFSRPRSAARRLVRALNRSVAAGLTCVAVVAVVGGALYIVVAAFIGTGDRIVASLKDAAQGVADHFGAAGTSLDDLATNARKLLTALFLVFFLRDSHKAADLIRGIASGKSGDTQEAMARRAYEAVEGFIRGTSFITLIDAFLSGAIAVLVALAHRGFVIALWVLGVVLAVQVLEGHVLTPMIQSRTVQMHPAVVMVAITAGASVAGVLGMLLAVPLTAAAYGVVHELRARYQVPEPSDS